MNEKFGLVQKCECVSLTINFLSQTGFECHEMKNFPFDQVFGVFS